MCISIHALLAESDAPQPRNTLPSLDFYPRSPCGERHIMQNSWLVNAISIHALLAESDAQFTAAIELKNNISIHALLAESDLGIPMVFSSLGYFYPRSPCGERHYLPHFFRFYHLISIHALLAESDLTISERVR